MANFQAGPAGLSSGENARLIFVPIKLGDDFKLVVFVAGPAGFRDRDIAADEIMGRDKQAEITPHIR